MLKKLLIAQQADAREAVGVVAFAPLLSAGRLAMAMDPPERTGSMNGHSGRV